MKKEEIDKRREKVKEEYNQGKSQSKIAQELGVTGATISRDIVFLEEQGEIDKKSILHQEEIDKRREKVEEQYKQGKLNSEIAKKLGVSLGTISTDIAFLKKQGKIDKKTSSRQEEIDKRREKVKEKYKQGKSQKEIAEELGVSVRTVSKDIAFLEKQDEKTSLSQEERRKKVKEKYNQGKLNSEIAQELGVSKSTVTNDIAFLKKQGEIYKKPRTLREETKERIEKVKEMYNQGKLNSEIAEELDVSETTVSNYIAFLKKQGEIDNRKPEKQKEIDKKTIIRQEEIDNRRKKVKEKYEQGKSQNEIAQELGVSQTTVSKDIAFLEKQGEIDNRTNLHQEEIDKRREKVKEMYNQGKFQNKIAKELGVSENTVSKDIAFLKKQGEIDNRKSKKQKEIDKRREKVKEMYNQGKLQNEIAEELNVSKTTVSKDIAFLEKQGEIDNRTNLHQEEIDKRREKVKEMYNQGKSNREIAQELSVSVGIVSNDIVFLKEKGEIDNRKNLHQEEIDKRREKVKEMYNQGKSNSEIAQELDIILGTVSNDITFLKKQGEIDKTSLRQEIINKRREKVKEKYKQGKSQKEIAEELGVSEWIISNDIAFLEKQGEIDNRKKPKEKNKNFEKVKRIEKLCENFCGEPRTLKEFEKYISCCKDRFKQGTLSKEEIPTIKNVIILTEKYHDIVWYLKVCIKKGKIMEAMNFANSQIHNEIFSKNEKAQLEELRKKINELNKKYIALKTLKRGEGVQKAISDSGLLETEVVEINRKLLQKRTKYEEKNNGEEEPKK